MMTCKARNGIVGDGVRFERIRRITGYLVGGLDRFNNGKAAEERDRVGLDLGTGLTMPVSARPNIILLRQNRGSASRKSGPVLQMWTPRTVSTWI